MSIRSEQRRIKRGRQWSRQSGQGHGERTYVPVRQTNRMVSEEARERRRLTLAARDTADRAYLEALQERVRKRESGEDD